MAICCCSLAGTAACKHCFNNPDATEPFSKVIPSTGTNPFYQQLAELTLMKHGKDISDFQKYHCEFKCSVCGADIGVIEGGSLDGGGPKFKYCPNCGAKMEEVKP